ncbi:queuosine precursor transporter [Leptospira borgpetersenii]|uniref:queuosine precursor transporter n=1 Tax=Leptospira borgpetersenii TaxID=174 RepID=UPI002152A7EA|nr:queuosine precursor transporter [Leptospira borgpetersenii]UVA62824.1 queuosine precursor transporter [Leptospira borgpetersenii]
MPLSKSQKLFIILNAFFLTFLILAEVTGSKLFVSFGFTLTMGVIPFPVTFIVTENKYIWLRATGSTIVSQLVDSFVVIYIALSGGKLSFQELNQISTNNFIYKCGVAIAITPLIYGAHHCINWYLGKEAEEMIEFAMKEGRSDIKPD